MPSDRLALTLRWAFAVAMLVCAPRAAAAGEDAWFQQQFKPSVADVDPAARARPRIPATIPAAPPAPVAAPHAVAPHAAAANAAAPLAAAKPVVRGWRTVVYPAPKVDTGVRVASIGPSFVPETLAKPLTGYAHELRGLASYYWEDQLTSSGERFDRRALTAAHKTLPLGTRVRVTNLTNGRSAVVRINDRGPYKGGRVIDLSEAAALQIDMTGPGLARVAIEVVQ